MRLKLAILTVFLFCGLAVSAQETYSLAASAAQVADLRQHVLAINRGQCRRLGLAATCTQAQACTAANAPGGASCTAVQARTAGARIWPDTQAGREEFVLWTWNVPRFVEARTSLPAQTNADYCAWWDGQNQAAQDAECAKVGAPAGCSICP